MACMNVYYAPVVQHPVQAIGGILINTLVQPHYYRLIGGLLIVEMTNEMKG